MLYTKVPGGNEILDAEYILKNKLGLTYGAKVGDFGCGGGGYFALQAAKLVGDRGEVFAVDILKSVLNNVASRARSLGLENIVTVWSNLEVFGATKILDGTLDYGLLMNVLFQNKDPRAIIHEAVRMLKVEGQLLILDWKEGRFPLGPLPQDKVPLHRVREMVVELSLSEAASFDAGPFHYGIIFKKVKP
ncbi:MAG: methyltransferase domain-containing protein [Patescibacteria group bacterium]